MSVTSARLRRRVRREVEELRSPSATGLRWLRVVADNGAVAYDAGRSSIDALPLTQVQIGEDVRWGDHIVVHLGPEGTLVIGDGARIGTHVTIAADARVEIGPSAWVGDFALISDTWGYGRTENPVVEIPNPEPVSVGHGARVGMRAVVGPGTIIHPGASVPMATRPEIAATDPS